MQRRSSHLYLGAAWPDPPQPVVAGETEPVEFQGALGARGQPRGSAKSFFDFSVEFLRVGRRGGQRSPLASTKSPDENRWRMLPRAPSVRQKPAWRAAFQPVSRSSSPAITSA